MKKRYKTIFLDRDGTLNFDPGYISRVKDFQFYSFTFDALKLFKNTDSNFCIITNQSGIGRGYYSKSDYKKLTKRYLSELRKDKIIIDAVYHCPHDPSKFEKYSFCNCRKPNPGMIIEAIRSFNIDPKKSIIIG